MKPLMGAMMSVAVVACGRSQEGGNSTMTAASNGLEGELVTTVADRFVSSATPGDAEIEFIKDSADRDRRFSAGIFRDLLGLGYSRESMNRGYYTYGWPQQPTEARRGEGDDRWDECEIADFVRNLHESHPNDPNLGSILAKIYREALASYENHRSIRSRGREIFPKAISRSENFAYFSSAMAQGQLQRALCLNPGLAGAWLSRAEWYESDESRRAALEYALSPKATIPLSEDEHARAQSLLSKNVFLRTRSDLAEVTKNFERIRRTILDDKGASDLRTTVFTNIEVYEKSFGIAPKALFARDYLTWGASLAAIQRDDEAVEVWKRGLESVRSEARVASQDPMSAGEINVFLALILYRMGRVEDSRQCSSEARRIFQGLGPSYLKQPPFPEYRVVLENLDKGLLIRSLRK